MKRVSLGKYDEALDHLDACKSVVVDGFGWRKKRAELLLYAGRRTLIACPFHMKRAPGSVLDRNEAVKAWVSLIRQPVGADNYHFHRGLQCALLEVDATKCLELMREKATRTPTDVLVLSDTQVTLLDDAYAALASEQPRADAFAWLPLTYCPAGSVADAQLDAFCRRFLKRGAPALGSALERLWAPHQGDVVEGRCRGSQCCRKVLDIAKTHAEALSISRGKYLCRMATLPLQQAKPGRCTLQAHCLEWLGQLDEAMSVIDRAIAHTPTAVDFPEKKARLLKKAGRIQERAAEMKWIRPTARYINNKRSGARVPAPWLILITSESKVRAGSVCLHEMPRRAFCLSSIGPTKLDKLKLRDAVRARRRRSSRGRRRLFFTWRAGTTSEGYASFLV